MGHALTYPQIRGVESNVSFLCKELFDFNTSLLSSLRERVGNFVERHGFQADFLVENVKADDVLLFDMDGTLIDTDVCNTLAYKAAIEVVLGTNYVNLFDTARIERKLLQERLSWISDEHLSQIISLKEKFYAQFIEDIELIPSTMAILNLFTSTHKVCLVTNARRSRVMQTLSHFGLESAFDAIITRDDCNGSNKFTTAISQLSLNPQKVWVFENEEAQAAAAIAAGIDVKHIILR